MIVNAEKMEELNTRRKILSRVICTLLVEAGYDTADKQAVEVLTEMLQSCEYLSYFSLSVTYVY